MERLPNAGFACEPAGKAGIPHAFGPISETDPPEKHLVIPGRN